MLHYNIEKELRLIKSLQTVLETLTIKADTMNTITTLNTKLTKATKSLEALNVTRAEMVQAVITEVLNYSKSDEIFTNRKTAMKHFIKTELTSKTVDAYTKRALKVASAILVDGYKVKRELLTLAQIEMLLKFSKNSINALMKLEEDDYIIGVKELIKSANIIKEASAFSASVAKSL